MPTTTGFATDLITFARGSLATVTDSDGYIKWAQHNLLLASEQLDTSSWTKTSATIAANSIAAPDSAITADTIVASGANGTVLQSYTAVAIPYVFGVWLRRKTGTGNIQIAADNGTYTTVTITNDWALYTVTQTPTAGTKSAGIRIVTNGDEVYAWGAHLYRSDLGGMQANASAYPYYNPSTLKNLLGFTELLTTGWTNTNTTDTQVAIAAPNGSDNSIDVAATAGNGTLLASLSLLASPYTFSIWLRRKTGTGTVQITVDGTTYVTAAVTADWQRFSTTLTPTAGTKTPGIRIVTSGDAVYAWGAQLSDSASLDPYTPNFGAAPSAAAAHGPRLDYDPSTLAAKGLLVEEQRTNLALNSATFDVASWGRVQSSISLSSINSPAGNLTAYKLIEDTANSFHATDISITFAAVDYTVSVYAKAAERNWIFIQENTSGSARRTFFNVTAGTVGTRNASHTASISSVGNGWYRCSITFATAAVSSFVRIGLANADNSAVYAGDGTSGLDLYGPQIEAGAFATSYIPTAAASATRNADVASVGVSQFPASSTAFTLGIKFIPMNTAAPAIALSLFDASPFPNRIQVNLFGNVAVFNSGILEVNISSGVTTGQRANRYAAIANNDFATSLNGGAVETDTSVLVPSGVITLGIGNIGGGTLLSGWIENVIYIPRRLTNAEIQARSA